MAVRRFEVCSVEVRPPATQDLDVSVYLLLR